ncbi:unnamed protein product [Ectocarpus sp. CCAP 1310/34]|nr:unnamed protein product [Ectocarpus sp. CCAP 1310/34]
MKRKPFFLAALATGQLFDVANAFHVYPPRALSSRGAHVEIAPTRPFFSCLPAGSCGAHRRRSCSGRRELQLALESEALAVGAAMIAGAAIIGAGRGLSTLAGAFKLADYRTTSGHDLRLDEKLGSKRRRLDPSSETTSGSLESTGGRGASETALGVETDWREEVRLASQLPDDGVVFGGSGGIEGDDGT